MTNEEVLEQLELLRNGTVEKITIQKEDFLQFRAILIEQEDFKHFIGIAKHGGHTIYSYQKNN